MGKASSAKKVARAARAGGTAKRDRPKIGFPLAVFVIVLLGTSLVVFARTSREPASAAPPSYLNSDHWHAAYGVYVCDAFLPAWTDAGEDRDGIHTHGDGIIHIHPFSASASGSKARLSVFGKQVGVTFTNDGFTTPDGTEYKDGYDCNGTPGNVMVVKWNPDDPNAPGEVYDSNFNNIVFDRDRAAYTIAVVPEGVVPPMPESIPTLDNLTDVAGSSAAGTTGTGTSGLDTSGISLDPTTGQPILPTDSSVVTVPPVTDASGAPVSSETTPSTAGESTPASSTP